jgi:3-methylfumaryl-CoA hydratase
LVDQTELARVDIAQLRKWVGKTETVSDRMTPVPIAALAATLDVDVPAAQPADAVPPLWHWLYFLPIHKRSELAVDGHAARGGFLPPIELPHRMWAGGRLEFNRPMRVGETYRRVSRIVDVQQKEGRSGTLVFVVVRHEISNAEGAVLVEQQDLVYRGGSMPGARAAVPQPAPADAAWERTIYPDNVLLFRYSALTFNGHRIHYDRRYATEVEGYPGLVVHGPLVATLLLDLLRRNLPGVEVRQFAFRAVSPLFDTVPFAVRGRCNAGQKEARLWAANSEGGLAMDSTATLS